MTSILCTGLYSADPSCYRLADLNRRRSGWSRFKAGLDRGEGGRLEVLASRRVGSACPAIQPLSSQPAGRAADRIPRCEPALHCTALQHCTALHCTAGPPAAAATPGRRPGPLLKTKTCAHRIAALSAMPRSLTCHVAGAPATYESNSQPYRPYSTHITYEWAGGDAAHPAAAAVRSSVRPCHRDITNWP
jgi:hypothetical protein